jgi:putative SOS response-associated peptidase YedK
VFSADKALVYSLCDLIYGPIMCYSILVEQDRKKLADRYRAQIDQMGFDEYLNNTKVDPKKYKPLAENPRIYPNYWAPIIIANQEQRVITPMRYRLRPAGSREEIPSKFNVFNCRLDAIDTRKTWKPIFMKRHGVLIFKAFFEWVVDKETGKKRVICFYPDNGEDIICPVLWDEWRSPDGKSVLKSFAVITHDPAPEVLAQGHDRTPIFLREEHMDAWLNPSKLTKNQAMALLLDNAPVCYQYKWAA